MGYQALLFCPDEKTARTVTQVLGELDFNVTPCTEPFAAVKKLMAEHFDAVVVDCDNEQNATLLFKSARNTTNNQSALAVAVVEGQAGVAKAFRIGANLVLTKPINVEQAKGTLRVARGLLRKNEAAKPATAAANPKPGGAVSSPPEETATSHADQAPSSPVIAAAVASGSSSKPSEIVRGNTEHFEPSRNEIVAPVISKPGAQPYASDVNAASAHATDETTTRQTAFGHSAASAPAPAREPKAGASTRVEESTVLPDEAAGNVPDYKENKAPVDGQSAPAPMFTFGGTVGAAEESAGGGSKKIIFIAVAAVVVAAASYAAWTHWGRSSDSTPVPAQAVQPPVKAPAAIPQSPPSPAASDKVSAHDTQPATAETVQPHPSKPTGASDAAKPSPASPAVTKAPEPTAEAEPIVIKNNLSRPAAKSRVISDAPAPPSMTIAPAGDGGLPNLMDSPSNAPTPVLQTLSVSQGVSQGLLLKKVQPKYPPNALHMRVEGAVQLMATISKDGDISAVKILSGEPQLAHAALDAVKQWKYKPYLLNGEPVEIQTQITVNFKLPN